MKSDEITNVLNLFARWPCSFMINELLDFVDSTINCETLQTALLDDSRFICLGLEQSDESRFVPKVILFQWFSNLNMRLAEIRKFRLDQHQLALAMSSLRRDGRWNIPPEQAVQFGKYFGLVGSAWTADQYVFPLARFLSCLPRSSFKTACSVLKDFPEILSSDLPFERLQQKSLQVLQEAFQEAPLEFSERQIYIVKTREGLLTGNKMTLEQISRDLNLTKERVRQLENKFWETLLEHRPREQFVRRWLLQWVCSRSPAKHLKIRSHKAFVRALLAALLCDVMRKQGSLIYSTDSSEASLAKCIGMPQLELSHIGLVILAAREAYFPKDLTTSESRGWFPDEIDANTIANRLDSECWLCLIDADLRILAESIAQFRQKRLKKPQRVYLALRAIGRPAHYSEITEVYNSLFPDRLTSERNVHSILSREEEGVVWIGVRGTFALKEWGYERPSKTLFETVAEVVHKRYEETGKPVPFAVITAEITKYRKVVRPTSLIFAAHCNPGLRRVSRDSFIPKGPCDQAQDEISLDELDKILQEFQQQSSTEEESQST